MENEIQKRRSYGVNDRLQQRSRGGGGASSSGMAGADNPPYGASTGLNSGRGGNALFNSEVSNAYGLALPADPKNPKSGSYGGGGKEAIMHKILEARNKRI